MAIEDYVGQRIRLRAEVGNAVHCSGRWRAEKALALTTVHHAETGEWLGGNRTVVYAKSAHRDDIGPGTTVEFEARISRPKGEAWSGALGGPAAIDASLVGLPRPVSGGRLHVRAAGCEALRHSMCP